MNKLVVFCIDAMGQDYWDGSEIPRLKQMAQAGTYVAAQGVVPSVTNVNNVSILTGRPPRDHGMHGNVRYDRATGEETLIEAVDALGAETLLQWGKRRGMTTALLTAKEKLLRILNRGADFQVCAEAPSDEMTAAVGPKQDIYSAAVNHWLIDACHHVLSTHSPDLVYCSTTDYIQHKHAPEDEVSLAHMGGLDERIGRILDDFPEYDVIVTADHGMNDKTRAVNLRRVLADAGVEAHALPVIRDRYVAHHGNLGGVSYIYLKDAGAVDAARHVLSEAPGALEVLSPDEAADRYMLSPDQVGDLMVLGDEQTVFGDFAETVHPVEVRSHGSIFERNVPIASNVKLAEPLAYNFEAVARWMEWQGDAQGG